MAERTYLPVRLFPAACQELVRILKSGRLDTSLTFDYIERRVREYNFEQARYLINTHATTLFSARLEVIASLPDITRECTFAYMGDKFRGLTQDEYNEDLLPLIHWCLNAVTYERGGSVTVYYPKVTSSTISVRKTVYPWSWLRGPGPAALQCSSYSKEIGSGHGRVWPAFATDDFKDIVEVLSDTLKKYTPSSTRAAEARQETTDAMSLAHPYAKEALTAMMQMYDSLADLEEHVPYQNAVNHHFQNYVLYGTKPEGI